MKATINKSKKTLGRTQLSRNLRQSQTPAEKVLWDLLRAQKVDGLKFRRQHPLGKFIADFYCPELRLAIELDGGVHKKTVEQDRARDEAIAQHHVRVIRLKNRDVLSQPDEVIREKIRDLTLSPSPHRVEREEQPAGDSRNNQKGVILSSNPHDSANKRQAKRLVLSPSPGHVEREGGARERYVCEICGKPLTKNQRVLIISNRKVEDLRDYTMFKGTVEYACHWKCQEQIKRLG